MQQIRPGLRQQGMDHRAAPDDDLAHRLRAGIDAGDLPAPDLADVQRRADRRARRRTVRTTAVAGASVLALVGVLSVAVPAISDVVAARDGAPAALVDRPQGAAEPNGDLTDPSVWPTLPAVRDHEDRYLSAPVVGTAVGKGTWSESFADMLDPWVGRECSPGPLRDTSETDAELGPRPSSTHSEPWSSERFGSDGTMIGDFTELAVLRWGSAVDGAGPAWRETVAQEAAGCPGAVRVQPGATVGGEPAVVVARPYAQGVVGSEEGLWSAMAIVGGGPTAVQVRYGGASGAQEAGDAALALLRAGVGAVTASDRLVRGTDASARSGGVDAARLTEFIDTQRWTTVPPLRTIGPPPKVWLSTSADLDAAFPGTRSWESGSIGGTGTDWMRSWCTPDALVGSAEATPRPADEMASVWEGRSGVLGRPRADIDVLRWRRTAGAVDDPGVNQVDHYTALEAADAWGVAIADDATACPGAVALDPAGLPGERATLTAVDEGGRWRVQAIAVGGPTAVRVRATIEADDAAAAGDRAVAMARRVVANTVRADAVEQGRTDPGPLP